MHMNSQREPWRVGVVVPAQNEADTIQRCIRSIRSAHDSLIGSDQLWIVVVADTCSDSTAALARSALGGWGEVVECEVRSAGAARQLGVAAVLRHFNNVPSSTIWLANTDADSHVPADWLQRHLQFAQDGDIAVAGIVELEINSSEAQRAEEALRPIYQFADDGSHSHVHGANLGVRADAYLAVGGWSHLPLAEDHCLWNRLKAGGWRLRSSMLSCVTTSARLQGRAVGGFADTLRGRMQASVV
jgi:cellulose synthase/poly-beta-1,6-N-acetylglucosamine synthase-like glycosyltransferase